MIADEVGIKKYIHKIIFAYCKRADTVMTIVHGHLHELGNFRGSQLNLMHKNTTEER